ncbi:MAG: hypothetical protein M1817_005780 [Caeruleum heppii]|nr:MAG: hypothetical protein M1817_005780 [Caeruleum heppii]
MKYSADGIENMVAAAASTQSSGGYAARLTPRLRSDVNALLITGGGMDRIHAHLLHALTLTPLPTAIKTHCRTQIRTGAATTHAQLMASVRREIKQRTRAALAAFAASSGTPRPGGKTPAAPPKTNGKLNGKLASASANAKGKDGTPSKPANGVDTAAAADEVATGKPQLNGSTTASDPADYARHLVIPEEVIQEGIGLIREVLGDIVELD